MRSKRRERRLNFLRRWRRSYIIDPCEKPSSSSMTKRELIVREQEPLNLEMPFSSLDGFITPNESFYVRCHFPIPEISPEKWRLKIEGEVEAPFELSYDDLRAMETRTIAATL